VIEYEAMSGHKADVTVGVMNVRL